MTRASGRSCLLQNMVKEKLAQLVVDEAPAPVGMTIRCKRVVEKQEFQCQAADLYRALTDKDVSASI